jgi:hypothetical protein
MKILAAIPLTYWEGGEFWSRDLGLVVLALRAAGHDAHFVALGQEDHATDDRPVKLISRKTMGDPDWWRAQMADGIILNTWSATRYEDIRTAALSARCPVIEKMDTDGIRSPRTWFWRYVVENWSADRDSSSAAKRFLAWPLAFSRAVLLRIFPGLLDLKLAMTMSKMPVLAVETPVAVERIRRFVREMGQPTPRIDCIPHPVEELFQSSAEVARTNKVIAVGRWTAHVKNFPLLLRVLNGFLSMNENWTADVVGGLPHDLEKQLSFISPETRARIHFAGLLDHQALAARYQSSRIFVMSSRYESFNIAAAEALCCGCSVVGPVEIPSIQFFTGRASGTPACRNSEIHLLDALCAEAEAWRRDWRDPEQISADWLKIVGAKAIVDQIVCTIESVHADADAALRRGGPLADSGSGRIQS